MMTVTNPPALIPLTVEGIPAALREQKRWAPWRAVWNEKRKKFDKVPHRADQPNYGISTAKPEQWASFGAALAAYNSNPKLFAGIGYVMTGPHGVIGTDLDNCVTDGVIAPWAQEVIDQLGSYTEISPSGNGLRILSAGEQTNDWNNHEIGIEVYGGNEARFLTVTGVHVAGTPTELAAPADGVLPALESRYAKERRRAEVIDLNMPDLIDDALLPSLTNLDIPPAARDFLDSGAHRGDRSRELFATAVALYGAGLPDDEVFSILAQNQHAMEIALDHRRQDHDRALLYLWREQCCKGKARVPQRLTADEFDDVSSPVSRDLSMVKEQRFAFQQAADFARRKPISWLVKRLLPSTGLCVLFGESGSGKSFFTLDMAASVARGAEWRSMRVKQGKVAYICAEGAGGFQNRLAAYAEHHGIDLADLDLAVLGDAPNFMETADVRDLVTSLKSLGALAMVVVDTAARVMPGANENSGEDMGRVVKHCDLISRVTGALVVLVHHSGKDSSRGARGWSGLRAAADVEIEVVRAGDDRAATVSKMKDGEDGAEFGFTLTTVPVFEDDDGETITSCVLQHTAAVPKAQRKAEPKGAVEKLVCKVLADLTDIGADTVDANTLVEACVAQLVAEPDGKRDRRRERVMRALESVTSGGQVVVENGEVRCA